MSRIFPTHSTDNTIFARALRKNGNPAEKFLWSKIRNKNIFGLKFRKQVPFGPYVLDFLCISKRLVIEIDGDSHYEEGRKEYDAERDEFLKKHGLTVLRLGHRETLQNIDEVLERMRILLGLEHE